MAPSALSRSSRVGAAPRQIRIASGGGTPTAKGSPVVMATPALSDGLMVVRTTGHVVGLAAPDRAARAR